MNNKPRNPSAFPAGLTEGMTLRDYFAAKFMQGFVSGALADGASWNREHDEKNVAEVAYYMADAMLAEREREE